MTRSEENMKLPRTLVWILESASVTALASTGRSSPTLKVAMSLAMLSPPKFTNMGSRTLTKKREAPGSPWRPERPRSWLSMRR